MMHIRMLTQRFIKKTTYATGAAIVVVVVVSVTVYFTATPAPAPTPSATPASAYRPVAVEKVDIVRHATSLDVVARLRNPNSHAGIKQYPVTFVILNPQQQEITRHTETSYILPGSLQYVAGIAIPIDEVVGSVRVDVPATPIFTDLPAQLDLPNFGSFLRERGLKTIGRDTVEEQKGIVRNNSNLDFERVEVTAVASDSTGVVTGVGKTFVGTLKVGEQREFTIQWPAPAKTTVNIITLPSTNVFVEENLIRVIGDPSSLR